MSPDVIDVEVKEDYTLLLTFDNNEKKIFDVKPYMEKGIFVELKNPVYFKTVKVWDGTIAWPHEQDFCPDTLYMASISYKE